MAFHYAAHRSRGKKGVSWEIGTSTFTQPTKNQHSKIAGDDEAVWEGGSSHCHTARQADRPGTHGDSMDRIEGSKRGPVRAHIYPQGPHGPHGGHINPLISPENSDTSNTHIFGDYVPRHAHYCVLPSIEKLPPFPSFNLPIFAYRFGFSLALLALHTSLPNRDLDYNTVPRLHDILIAAPMGSIRVEPSLSSDV